MAWTRETLPPRTNSLLCALSVDERADTVPALTEPAQGKLRMGLQINSLFQTDEGENKKHNPGAKGPELQVVGGGNLVTQSGFSKEGKCHLKCSQ